VFHWRTGDNPDNPNIELMKLNPLMTSLYGTMAILAAPFKWQQVPAVILSYFYIFFGVHK
jgi:hypothetical protein